MGYVLIKTQADYADEFDVYGLEVIESDKCALMSKAILDKLKKGNSSELYFGTNEELAFKSQDDFLDFFDFEPITEEVKNILEKYGLNDYGNGMFQRLYEDLTS